MIGFCKASNTFCFTETTKSCSIKHGSCCTIHGFQDTYSQLQGTTLGLTAIILFLTPLFSTFWNFKCIKTSSRSCSYSSSQLSYPLLLFHFNSRVIPGSCVNLLWTHLKWDKMRYFHFLNFQMRVEGISANKMEHFSVMLEVSSQPDPPTQYHKPYNFYFSFGNWNFFTKEIYNMETQWLNVHWMPGPKVCEKSAIFFSPQCSVFTT